MISAVKLSQNAKAAPDVATAVKEAKGECVLEPKLDGWRILAHVHEDGVELYSRTAKKYGGTCPRIEAFLMERLPPGSWVDGEIIAPEGWGSVQSTLSSTPDKAARVSDPLTYVLFDIIAHGRLDLRPLPMRERRRTLERIFGGVEEPVKLTVQLEPTDENHQRLLDEGEEGSMVKELDAPYASGKRGHGWRKLKAKWTIDAILTRLDEGTNSNAGKAGTMVFSQYQDGELVQRGRCKVLGDKLRDAITADPDAYLGRVIEVAHMGMQVDGLRHPQFKRWRDDKLPADCTYHNE